MSGQIYPNYESPTGNLQGVPVSPQSPGNGQLLIYSAPANTYIPGDPVVSGPNPVGTPPTANPVQIGGQGADGNVHEIQTDVLGNVRIDASTLLDALQQILYELRAIKTVLMGMDNTLLPQDFDAASYSDQQSQLP